VINADFRYEKRCWQDGMSLVAGVDEVGRGAWAGPLVAAAVVFPRNTKLGLPLRDSKLLTPKKRRELVDPIKERALAFAFGEAAVSLIEERGIQFATEYAMHQAVRGLGVDPEIVLTDYFRVRFLQESRQRPIKKGDQLSATIAASSILAKVERDELVSKFDQVYPDYGFSSHKGYGTKAHQEAIHAHGTTEIHRISFIPERLLKHRR